MLPVSTPKIAASIGKTRHRLAFAPNGHSRLMTVVRVRDAQVSDAFRSNPMSWQFRHQIGRRLVVRGEIGRTRREREQVAASINQNRGLRQGNMNALASKGERLLKYCCIIWSPLALRHIHRR